MSSDTLIDPNFCFPIKELSNERLKLTPFIPSVHATEFFQIASQYPEIFIHVSGGPYASEQEYVEKFVKGIVQADPGMFLFAIIDKTRPTTSSDPEGALAGSLTYMNSSAANLATEIGHIYVLPPFQRTHVTTNAVGLMMRYALELPENGGLGLRRVQWCTSSVNFKSQRAADRFGFQKEGVLKWAIRFPGGKSKGKEGNGRVDPKGRGDVDDLGRDTFIYSHCWDDWENGGREKIQALMDRRS